MRSALVSVSWTGASVAPCASPKMSSFRFCHACPTGGFPSRALGPVRSSTAWLSLDEHVFDFLVPRRHLPRPVAALAGRLVDRWLVIRSGYVAMLNRRFGVPADRCRFLDLGEERRGPRARLGVPGVGKPPDQADVRTCVRESQR